MFLFKKLLYEDGIESETSWLKVRSFDHCESDEYRDYWQVLLIAVLNILVSQAMGLVKLVAGNLCGNANKVKNDHF